MSEWDSYPCPPFGTKDTKASQMQRSTLHAAGCTQMLKTLRRCGSVRRLRRRFVVRQVD
jgi:hypothetical protein